MISIEFIGSAGIGFVWGWILGNLITRVCRPIFDSLMITGLTLILAADIFILVDAWALIIFLGMTGIAKLLYTMWRRNMYKKFDPPVTNLKGDLS